MAELAVNRGGIVLPDNIMSRWGVAPDGDNNILNTIVLAGKAALVIPGGQTLALIEEVAPESHLSARARKIDVQSGRRRGRSFADTTCIASNERVHADGQLIIPYSIRRPESSSDGGTVHAEDLNSAVLLLPSDTPRNNRRRLINSLLPVATLVDGGWMDNTSSLPSLARAYSDWQTKRGRRLWKLIDEGGSTERFGATRHQDTVLGRQIGLHIEQDTIKAALDASIASSKRRP